MKIAVTNENGQVFQHFGHCKSFLMYEVEGGKIVSKGELAVAGSGHSALAGLLRENGAAILICGGIGAGAKTALDEMGIQLVAGVSGDTDAAVEGFLQGTLHHNDTFTCNHHHEEGHQCGERQCGGH